MKQRLTKTEIEELKKRMRSWHPSTLQDVAKLYHHIAFLEERVEKQQAELLELRNEVKSVTERPTNPWPSPATTYVPVEVAEEERGTKKNRLIRLFRKGLVDSDEWKLNLKHSRLTHEQAMEVLREAGEAV